MSKPPDANRHIDVEEIRAKLADRAADVAHQLLGEPNAALSSDVELRFGSRGSLSVDLTKGAWFDHEANQGGDLIDLIRRERSCGFPQALRFARHFVGSVAHSEPPRKPNGQQRAASKIIATYDYQDERGALLFQVVRFEPKDFRQRRPDGNGGWIWSTKGVKQVPYRLPDLIESTGKVVFVVEGERDVDRLRALGVTATCNAGGAGKWRPELTEFFRGADVVIIPDNDPQKRHPKTKEPMFHPDGMPVLPRQDHAQAVAASLQGIAKRVRVLELWHDWVSMPVKGDVSDWIENGGTAEQLKALIENVPDWSPPQAAKQDAPEEGATCFELELERLARLSLVDYERERKAAAEAFGVRASILDQLVQAERTRLGLDAVTDKQGRAISFPEPDLWPQPVDGAELLDQIAKTIGSHVIMPEASRDACALWAAHTFLLDGSMISPRLAVTSPTRGCGKTTTLDVVGQLVLRPLSAANISASAIFRVVEGFHPTLLVDEADSFLKDNEELRGVLNSGHRKGGAVLRTVGDDHEVRAFSTYGACAIALIGQLPGTLADRSVPIILTRRKRDEKITPFHLDRVEHLVVLARKLARWTSDNAVTIATTEPEVPAGLFNRAADNWAPLLKVAQVAGGNWLARGQKAALAGVKADIDDASLLELVLGDIRDTFTKRAANKVDPADRMPSGDLVAALVGLENRPWAELGKNDKPLTQNRLAKLLKPLAIISENIRIDDKVPKGYLLERFKEAFERYLDPEGAFEPLHRYEADGTGTSAAFQTATAGPDVADRKSEKPHSHGPSSGVADQKGGQGEEDEVCAYCCRPGDRPGGLVEAAVGDGQTVRLHRQCMDPYLRRLDEGDA